MPSAIRPVRFRVFTVRDPSLVSVDPDGSIHALLAARARRSSRSAGRTGRQRARHGARARDNRSAPPSPTPIELGVGQVITDISGDGFCVHGDRGANAEYALVPFYNDAVPGAAIQIQARGQGVTNRRRSHPR